ncbi:GCRV-induced gene 2p [Aplochiton taeniatus]
MSGLSVRYCGWEVTYDDSPLELGSSQTPKDGRVYTMYHGTSVKIARLIIANGFHQSPDGMLGPGVYVSRDQKKAERYPLRSSVADRVVLQLRVHTGRIKRIDKDNHPMQKSWKAAGYDTAWVPPNCGMQAVPSGLEEDCVFDPQRVEVSGIALAPNPTIQAELRQLINQSCKRPWTGGGVAAAQAGGSAGSVCSLCKRPTSSGNTHTIQQCWGCGKAICTLMIKHVCPASA